MRIWRLSDGWLWLSVAALVGLGMLAISSVSLAQGALTLVQKQLVALLMGVPLAMFLGSRQIEFFRAFSRHVYVLGVALLALVLVFGKTLNGTTGWFILGGYAFQPLEVMKIGLLLSLSRYLGEELRIERGWRAWWPVGWRTFVPLLLLLAQPDVGGAVLLLGLAFCMAVLAGLPWRAIAASLFIAILLAVPGWFSLSSGRQERILTFLNPARDPLGSGYHVLQAGVAIGSGGLFGKGIGGGSQGQLQFLPESQTDFIFAVIAEELGFFGVCCLFFATTCLLGRGISLAKEAEQGFPAYVAFGTVILLFIQAVVHVGANVSLLPATGVPYPFVSYGGTALLTCFFLLGILQSVSWSTRELRRH